VTLLKKFNSALEMIEEERGDKWFINSKYGQELPSTKTFILQKGKEEALSDQIIQEINKLA